MRYQINFFLIAVLLFTQVPTQAQNYDPSFFPIGVWSVKGDHRSVDDYLYEDINGELTMPAAAPALHRKLFSDLSANGFNAAFMSLDLCRLFYAILERDLSNLQDFKNLFYSP